MLVRSTIPASFALSALLGSFGALASDDSWFDGRWEGELQFEARYFPQQPQGPRQFTSVDGSVAYLQNYYQNRGDFSFEMQSFLRWDARDDRRSHADLRKLLISYSSDDWSLDVGIDRVFWGVTEFVHLVDVVNQTDFVEGLDDEQALGQAMARLQWTTDWGTTELFALPLFRERTFPGESGRLHDGIAVAKHDAQYRSGAEDKHIDVAIRWSNTLGPVDVSIAHFYGTSRDPLLVPEISEGELQRLTPYYDIVNQTSLELQLTTESWLWKLEALSRLGETTTDYVSVTGGFEYSFSGVFDSVADVGMIVEYVYDDRGVGAPTPFANDWVVGARLAFNDVNATEVLVGLVFDPEDSARFTTLEASRRIGSSLKLEFEARLNSGLDPENPAYSLRTEDFLMARLKWFF